MLGIMRRRPHRGLLALLGIVAVAATSCSSSSGRDEGQPGAHLPSASSTTPALADPQRTAHETALQVLRDWDERRSAAFAGADPDAVTGLYAPGSDLARQDLAVLRAYDRQGARITGLTPRVVSVRVRTASRRVVELVVVEQAVTRVAIGSQERTLTGSGFERRRLRFEQLRGSWRLSRVSAE